MADDIDDIEAKGLFIESKYVVDVSADPTAWLKEDFSFSANSADTGGSGVAGYSEGKGEAALRIARLA